MVRRVKGADEAKRAARVLEAPNKKRNGWQDVPPISFWTPCEVPPNPPQTKFKLP
jgi:hypothetical protein